VQAVASYPTYAEANDHQITLLAAGVDARVQFRPADIVISLGAGHGDYALMVEPDDLHRAAELLFGPPLAEETESGPGPPSVAGQGPE
jgi:hypothetical protein